MRAPPLVLMTLAALVLAGCLEGGGGPDDDGSADTDPTPTAPTFDGEPQVVEFRTLAAGQHAGVSDVQEAYRTQAAYEAFWANLTSNDAEPQAAPPVDFAREQVIAVVSENQSSGCYSLRVDNVTQPPSGPLTVRYTLYGPPSGAACTAVISQPYHVVAVPVRDAPVEFERRTVAGDPPEVPIRTLREGDRSGIVDGARLVIEDEDAWRAFWDAHTAGMEPAPPMPEVDFEEERVVAVVLAEKGTGGWRVKVSHLVYAGPGLSAWVFVNAPTGGATEALTQPHDIVAVPRGPPITIEVVGEDAPPQDAGEDAPQEKPDMRTIEMGSHSGHGATQTVIEDEAAWAEFWSIHGSHQMPPPERPDVDFATERVVAVVLQDKPNACWAVRVADYVESGNGATVEVIAYSPPPDMMCASVITQPFHFVAVPHGPPIKFDNHQEPGPPPG